MNLIYGEELYDNDEKTCNFPYTLLDFQALAVIFRIKIVKTF